MNNDNKIIINDKYKTNNLNININYINKEFFKDNNIKLILENDYKILKEKENTNIIEKNIINSYDEYVIQLFIQYLKINGKINDNIINELIVNKKWDLDSLLKIEPEFYDYIKLCDKLREYYLHHLIKSGIDVDNINTYEINKGQFDSIATDSTTIVSKYAMTLDLEDSILFERNGSVYQLKYNNHTINKIPEGSTILLHNSYSTKEILYILDTFAGTDTNVVLGTWGFDEFKKKQLKSIENYAKIIKLLSDKDKLPQLSFKEPLEIDGISCNSIIVNTKNLKKVFSSRELLSDKDINNISSINDSNFNQHHDNKLTLRK